MFFVCAGQLGNADIIQPGLIGLQPSLDECMDTLEPLPSLNGKTCSKHTKYVISCYVDVSVHVYASYMDRVAVFLTIEMMGRSQHHRHALNEERHSGPSSSMLVS